MDSSLCVGEVKAPSVPPAPGRKVRAPYKKRRKKKVVEEKREKKKGGRPFGSTTSDAKALIYVNALEEGKSKREARVLAGWSENNNSVDNMACVRVAVESIEQERAKLQETAGMTIKSIANRFHKRATSEDVTPGVQTDNDKALVGMLNYTPEKKVTVNTIGMMLEFKDVSLAELMEFRKEARGDNETD